MLFPKLEHVLQVWRTVAEAVSEGRLGTAAKIAAGTDKAEDDGIRLICVYTKDFTDLDDVARVVKELDKLGLLPKDPNRSIYYKCDAYTHLNIGSGNPYNLAASLYPSKDMLARPASNNALKRAAPPSKGKEPVRKKQTTLTKGGF